MLSIYGTVRPPTCADGGRPSGGAERVSALGKGQTERRAV
jgi:hypothetical protein